MVKAYEPNSEYNKKNTTSTPIKLDLINYLMRYGNRYTITGYQSIGTTGTQTILTVPSGYTLFIMSCTIQLTTTVTNVNTSTVFINTSTGYNWLFYLDIGNGWENINETQNYSIPLRMDSDESLKVTTTESHAKTSVSVIGYLISNSVLKELQ